MQLVCFYSKNLTSDVVNLDFCEWSLLSGGQRLFSGLKSPVFCAQRPAHGKILGAEVRVLHLGSKRPSSLWKRLPFDIEGPASAVKP